MAITALGRNNLRDRHGSFSDTGNTNNDYAADLRSAATDEDEDENENENSNETLYILLSICGFLAAIIFFFFFLWILKTTKKQDAINNHEYISIKTWEKFLYLSSFCAFIYCICGTIFAFLASYE